MFELGYSAYAVNVGGRLFGIESITGSTIKMNFFFVHPRSKLAWVMGVYL